MNITAAKYTESGGISATINGAETYVPDDLSGIERRAVQAWEGEGNVITPYSAPPPTIQQQINALESMVTPRNLRGAALGDAISIAEIQAIENQIAALRPEL